MDFLRFLDLWEENLDLDRLFFHFCRSVKSFVFSVQGNEALKNFKKWNVSKSRLSSHKSKKSKKIHTQNPKIEENPWIQKSRRKLKNRRKSKNRRKILKNKNIEENQTKLFMGRESWFGSILFPLLPFCEKFCVLCKVFEAKVRTCQKVSSRGAVWN